VIYVAPTLQVTRVAEFLICVRVRHYDTSKEEMGCVEEQARPNGIERTKRAIDKPKKFKDYVAI
jgi:hypothetical protein